MKADVLTIPKMWYFLRFKGFEPQLLAVKVGSILDIVDVLELFAKNCLNWYDLSKVKEHILSFQNMCDT